MRLFGALNQGKDPRELGACTWKCLMSRKMSRSSDEDNAYVPSGAMTPILYLVQCISVTLLKTLVRYLLDRHCIQI